MQQKAARNHFPRQFDRLKTVEKSDQKEQKTVKKVLDQKQKPVKKVKYRISLNGFQNGAVHTNFFFFLTKQFIQT